MTKDSFSARANNTCKTASSTSVRRAPTGHHSLGRFITFFLTGLSLAALFLLWSSRARVDAAPQSAKAKAPAGKQMTSAEKRLAASIGSWTSPANLCASDGLCTLGANATLLNTGVITYLQSLNETNI
ncbi:MAG TPA: hypothetical protein VG206_20815 [Terriglobia bacterium]|nr:hypothetical protein [Terriglobia bacterium]